MTTAASSSAMPAERLTVPLRDALRMLGVSKNKGYELAARNELPVPVVKIGDRYLVKRVDLDAFFAPSAVTRPE